jgi:hypothetical protein
VSTRRAVRALLIAGATLAAACRPAPFYMQAWLPAPHNWMFHERFGPASRMLNAFDYGHAVLYETLLTRGAAGAPVLEGREFDFITRRLLDDPPEVPLEEAAVGPHYAQLVPELVAMFDWAHLLHRQLYDIWADPRIADDARDRAVEAVMRHYLARHDLAFSTHPKSMALMEAQPYSLAFRRLSPRFNGLIWSYHWAQMALYDALLSSGREDERHAAVEDVLRRFRAMHRDPPRLLPQEMPLTPAIAPRFAARYPEASVVFDNMHALHDVVSDILASPAVPASEKRRTILRAAAAYRDDTTGVTTLAEWRAMALSMGADRMGGVAFPVR